MQRNNYYNHQATSYKNPYSNLITFNKDPSIYTAILAYMASTITNPKWDLSQGRYQLWGFRQQLLNNNIIQIKVQEINLKNNQKDINMIQEIIGVKWINLKKLVLDGNNIQSVQYLIFMQAPQLQYLCLNKNNITEIRSFYKCNFPQLKTLQLKQNRIKQLPKFSQWYFTNIKQLFLESSTDSQQQGQDLNVLCKSQFQLVWLFISSLKRVRDFTNVLRAKYKDGQIRAKFGPRVFNIVQNNFFW